MTFHNYKKNKLEKIKAFCAVVEQGSLAKASEHLSIASSAISMQIASLEYDLGVKLFDRNTRYLKLNSIGIEYYKNAKTVLNVVDDFFHNTKTLEITKYDIWILRIKEFYNLEKSKIIKKAIKWGLKTIKYFFILTAFSIIIFSYYLNYVNYFFDKKLYSLASPLIKNLIKDGYSRISEDVACSFGVTQLNLDMYDLMLKITKTKRYRNLLATMFILGDRPLISMRLTGKDEIDNIFNNENIIMCDTKKSYNATKKQFSEAKELFLKNPNFRIYNLSYKSIKDCLHCNYFIENMKKYPHNLFGMQIKKPDGIQNTRGWIIKYGNYYYLSYVTNIATENIQTNNPNIQQERHIFWKKLTENELINYDHGTYWKLIKNYNIKVS